jgi:hypothetical protein
VLTNTVEKANRNWRAPVNFLPPCTEGQPYWTVRNKILSRPGKFSRLIWE